jgi:hypothetical protein
VPRRVPAGVSYIEGVLGRRKIANVCFWHKADMLNAPTNVRFEGNNGHDAEGTRCLLMTQSGQGVTGYPVRLLDSGSSNVSCRA